MEHDVAVHIREHCVPYLKEKKQKKPKDFCFSCVYIVEEYHLGVSG